MTETLAPGAAAASCDSPIEWTVNPWRHDPRRSAGAVVVLVVTWLLLLGAGLSAVTAAALAIVVLAMYLPGILVMQCRVDAAGVGRRVLLGWDARPWNAIRRAHVRTDGLFVSPFPRPTWRDAHRGLFLPVPPGPVRRAVLLEDLRRRVAEHGL